MAVGELLRVPERLLVGVLAVAGLAVLVLVALGSERSADRAPADVSVQVVHPLWAAPDSLKGLIAEADAVVDGRVIGVEEGEPIKQPPRDGVPDGAIPDIPTQRVHVKVDHVIDGTAADTITLHQTGGLSRDGERDKRIVADHDPPFSLNERYVLFLSQRPEDGTYLYFGPTGRFKVDQDGRLQSEEAYGAAAELNGATASDVDARLDEERSKGS